MAYGQVLTPVTPKVLKQHREEYIQAIEEWQKGDTTLESELHGPSRDKLLVRINEEAGRTAKFLEAKTTYFASLRSYYQAQYIGYEGATGSKAQPLETKEEIQEWIDSVSRDRHELEDRIKNTPEIERRQKLAIEGAALKAIEQSLNDKKYNVEKWLRSEAGSAESRRAILASLKHITDVLAEQEKGTSELKDQLSRVYESMREVAGPVKSPPPPSPPLPLQFNAEPRTPPDPNRSTTQPARKVNSFAGQWVFIAKPGETNQPLSSVRLEIMESGDNLTGTFVANKAQKSLRGFPDPISFTFSGAKGVNYRWTAYGQSGGVEIISTGPGQTEVIWSTDNNNRTLFDGVFSRLGGN